MDFDFLREEEQFRSYLGQYQGSETTLQYENLLSNELHWDMDSDIQIDGDLGVTSICDINIRDDDTSSINIQQLMNGCTQLYNTTPYTNGRNGLDIDDVFEDSDEKDDLLDVSDVKNFDITNYLKDDYLQVPSRTNYKKPRAGVKKIDMEAQKYIIEEDDEVDVETVSECGDPAPILQAGDLNSLLEQFEASELPNSTLPDDFLEPSPSFCISDIPKVDKKNEIHENPTEYKPIVNIKQECMINNGKEVFKQESANHELKTITPDINIKTEPPLKEDTVDLPFIIAENRNIKNIKPDIKIESLDKQGKNQLKSKNSEDLVKDIKAEPQKLYTEKHTRKKEENCFGDKLSVPERIVLKKDITNNENSNSNDHESCNTANINSNKNKQIKDILPQELLDRIRESGKRKFISVIEPIVPNKKVRISRTTEPITTNKKCTPTIPNSIHLDHDYCSHPSARDNTDKKKDSGFESAEEEERTIIEKQPMVKNADGKLMVSLLKVNTIREEKTNKKKKLNLEEYKKRREGVLKSLSNSQSNSPLTSTCSSPLPEDEEVRRKKHQEKLMQMAMEILKTPVKSEKKSDEIKVEAVPKVVQVPPDMEMKTLVSIGINTEMKRKKNLDPLAPVEQLEQIKPVLQKIGNKINANSLITSLIENIPKVINDCSTTEELKSSTKPPELVHGEDKTIVYLSKVRTPPETKDAITQTNISLIQQSKPSRYRRRRNSSTSSSSSEDSQSTCSSSKSERGGRRSNSSRYTSGSNRSRSSRSSNSSYSSRSYSRSRSRSRSTSRSTSPAFLTRKERERERLREVEERRVIYVGRLATNITREQLRKRFQRFGQITNISLHSRQHGDKYGFVTFANKLDAYEAIEHGNDDPLYPKYDLSFGGRRIFCQTSYSDLDNMRDEVGYYAAPRPSEESFDNLLKDLQQKLLKRKA